MIIYFLRCKHKTETIDGFEVKSCNGRNMIKGTCSVRGTKKSVFLSSKDREFVGKGFSLNNLMNNSPIEFHQYAEKKSMLLLLLLLLHLITHPTKCYTNSKVRALSEKTNSEQVRLQVFRKSRWTNCQVPQLNRQLIPTAGTSNSKGSQTPIRPVARHNKIPRTADLKADRPETAEPLVQKATR